MNWIESLKVWRDNRDIVTPSGQYVKMIEEELDEYKTASCKEDKIDAIADIIVLSVNEMSLEGYSVNNVMNEVAKEISSRLQCPEQAQRNWKGVEKWKKDKDQDKNTLYKADIRSCKVY